MQIKVVIFYLSLFVNKPEWFCQKFEVIGYRKQRRFFGSFTFGSKPHHQTGEHHGRIALRLQPRLAPAKGVLQSKRIFGCIELFHLCFTHLDLWQNRPHPYENH